MAHVVVFSGEYDLANKPVLRREFRRQASSDDLVLDLTKVSYIDSTFISELMILEKARREKKFSRVTIVAPAKSIVRRVFEVTGITSIVGLVESYDGKPADALTSIRGHVATGDGIDATAETKSA